MGSDQEDRSHMVVNAKPGVTEFWVESNQDAELMLDDDLVFETQLLSRSRTGFEVRLHVYDLDSMTANLNDMFVHGGVNLGAFHCGVELLGNEWYYACGDMTGSGVRCNEETRKHPVHVYRETVEMGMSPLAERDIQRKIIAAIDSWFACDYHPITRNCVHFAEELLGTVEVPEPFPKWVRGAADAGKSSLIFPIADAAWKWLKWWKVLPPPPPEEKEQCQGDAPHGDPQASGDQATGSTVELGSSYALAESEANSDSLQ